jgi:hypothetical protein
MYKDQIEAYFRVITGRLIWSQQTDHHKKWVLIKWCSDSDTPTFVDINKMLNNQNAIILYRNQLFHADFLNKFVQKMIIPKEEATNAMLLKLSIYNMKTESQQAKDTEIKLILSIKGLLNKTDSVLKHQLERAGLIETHLEKLDILKKTLINGLETPDLNLLTILPSFNRPVIFAEALMSIYEATDQDSFNARFLAFNILFIQTKRALADRFNLLHQQKTYSADWKLKIVLITGIISILINLHFEAECKNRTCLNGFDIASILALMLYISDYYNRSKLDIQFKLIQSTETAYANLRSDILELRKDRSHPGFFTINSARDDLFHKQAVGLTPPTAPK